MKSFHIFIEELLFKQGKGFISHLLETKKEIIQTLKKIIEKEYTVSLSLSIWGIMVILFIDSETNKTNALNYIRCVQFRILGICTKYNGKYRSCRHHTITFKDISNIGFLQYSRTWRCCFWRWIVFIIMPHFFDLIKLDFHPKSPIKSDVRVARPGGWFFCEVGGNMLRLKTLWVSLWLRS